MTALYDGTLTHVRTEPMRRVFRHRVRMWLVDLDHLPRFPRWLRPFAGFHPADHLGRPELSIRDNLRHWLAHQGIQLGGGRVLMLTNARVLGHVFNPLTVFWCHDDRDHLVCVVAEVHNTYHERHCYLLRPGGSDVDKEFYVSPFFTVHGTYRMRLPVPGERLALSVSLHQKPGSPAFIAVLSGQRRAATPAAVLRTALTRSSLRVSALIHGHGIALWLRGLPVVPRTPHRGQEGVQ